MVDFFSIYLNNIYVRGINFVFSIFFLYENLSSVFLAHVCGLLLYLAPKGSIITSDPDIPLYFLSNIHLYFFLENMKPNSLFPLAPMIECKSHQARFSVLFLFFIVMEELVYFMSKTILLFACLYYVLSIFVIFYLYVFLGSIYYSSVHCIGWLGAI